ncbi:MAG: phosphoribosylformylglycinamidine cyclo-ligase [Thermovirgaceae bacterium]|nr:phosphoribosylformylglycinamidine cyclo-ligase [Thermovirgaceae bacterium]
MGWTYEKAGVSLERSNAWIDFLKKIGHKAGSPDVRSGIGGFAGLYNLGDKRILAACADGVGTKLEVARATNIFRGLGQDLVAMNVNDLVTCGAKPLFFLDYIACGFLDPDVFGPIMEGIVDACASCGCALLGGETAEMPDVYKGGAFDLAGFAVGTVHESDLVDGKNSSIGDVILGLRSSGVHSNGFSLIRKCLLEGENPLPLDSVVPGAGETLAETLMTPTRLYVSQASLASSAGMIRGMAHITGGGIEENVQRILPEGLKPRVDFSSWDEPPIFRLIETRGVDVYEMRKVFNLGIGFVLVAPKNRTTELIELFSEIENEELIEIGEVGR